MMEMADKPVIKREVIVMKEKNMKGSMMMIGEGWWWRNQQRNMVEVSNMN
ncbi:hypothetical protein [Candidatus Hodgkinia cicadicola]